MEQREMDRLVSVIADRVRARLTSLGDQPGPDCGPCTLGACDTCGLNPLNQQQLALPPTTIPDAAGMARFIDHTLLKPEADRGSIERLCAEARQHNFWSVCVNAGNVRLASSFLRGSNVKVCAVVGFPLGAGTPGAKAYETREAIRCGASEIDMVINIGALRSRDYQLVLTDIRKVVAAAAGKVVKVIFETGLLDREQIVIAATLSKTAGAHFVKTSTGFGPRGASVEDVLVMREVVGPDVGVKASGGVRNYDDAVAMLKAGANRLGCSSSVAIVTGGQGKSGY